MGEGWSDWVAASFLDDPVIGAYVTGNPTVGIRQQSMGNSTWTYNDVKTSRLEGAGWHDRQVFPIRSAACGSGSASASLRGAAGASLAALQATRDEGMIAGMRLFKGAARGRHWFQNPPGSGQGYSTSRGATDVDAITRHVIAYSYPSAFISFSASFAVACDYALSGGIVFEVDVEVVLRSHGKLVDPAAEILRANPRFKNIGSPFPTHHDGHQDVVPALARVPAPRSTLRRTPSRPGFAKTGRPPAIHDRLQALVFAVRQSSIGRGHETWSSKRSGRRRASPGRVSFRAVMSAQEPLNRCVFGAIRSGWIGKYGSRMS